MYHGKLESDRATKAKHDAAQKSAASDRLRKVAAAKAAKKKERKD